MKRLTGIIQKDGSVKANGKIFWFELMNTDREGNIEVLMDATAVGGGGYAARQSIKPYIGMKVEFIVNDNESAGYNYRILKS